MREIKKGELSVDLTKVSAIEKDDDGTLLYIDGTTFKWSLPYDTVLQILSVIKSTSSQATQIP